MVGPLEAIGEIELESLADRAYARIREAIINGQLRPGQKLAVAQVAEQLGVSRTPVRDAFQRLAIEGLLEVRRGIGAYVTHISRPDVEEIYMIRAVLEGLACQRAAKRMSSSRLERLKELLVEAKAAVEDGGLDLVVRAAGRLHEVIIEESGSPLLRDMVAELRDQIERFRRANALVPVRREVALEEHLGIVEALEKGDAELARRRMETHIAGALEVVLAQLNGEEVDTAYGMADW